MKSDWKGSFIEYCSVKHTEIYDYTDSLSKFLEGTNIKKDKIPLEFLNWIDMFYTKEPCIYYSKDAKIEIENNLEIMNTENDNNLIITTEMLENLYVALEAYKQITEIIRDLKRMNYSEDIKNRMYRLPTYTNIVEGCLSNLYRFLILCINQNSEKDFYNQKKLGAMIPILIKYNFILSTQPVDVNLRNAINHGGVYFTSEGKKIHFKYSKGQETILDEKSYFDFDELIEQNYDLIGGIILGLFNFITAHQDNIYFEEINKQEISLKNIAFFLSSPTLTCLDINDSSIDHRQLNCVFHTKETNRGILVQYAIIYSVLLYSQFPNYQDYFINFDVPYLLLSWVRFSKDDVEKMIKNDSNFDLPKLITEVTNQGNIIISDPSAEKISDNNNKTHFFKPIENNIYQVRDIENVSLENEKRISAKMYVGNSINRDDLLRTIDSAVSDLKTLENNPFSSHDSKYGTMDADAVLIAVYEEDERKNKGINLENKNFICFVEFRPSAKFTMKIGPDWVNFNHEFIYPYKISWRKKRFYKENQLGRNDPCPCKSGKKYKKCHG